ncbi:MAG: hypothetical protein JO202_02305 [Ktedonobacteraceae bacterium]|nr:hypothetical protein [Ktedonobacteraceae bacterium]
MAETKHKHLKIGDEEHVQMKTDCETLQKHMEQANSDIAFQGYRRAWKVLSEYYQKGAQELRALQEAEARKLSYERRQARLQKTQGK